MCGSGLLASHFPFSASFNLIHFFVPEFFHTRCGCYIIVTLRSRTLLISSLYCTNHFHHQYGHQVPLICSLSTNYISSHLIGCNLNIHLHEYLRLPPTNLPTARSPKETDIEPDVVNIQRSSWRWVQGCPKHVEEHSYWNKILCIKLEPEVDYYLRLCLIDYYIHLFNGIKDKAVPLQVWSGPEGSRKLRFPDFMTTVHEDGKVVSLTHRPPLPPGNPPRTHFCWRLNRPQGHSATGRIMSMKNSNDTIWDRTSDLPICSTAP